MIRTSKDLKEAYETISMFRKVLETATNPKAGLEYIISKKEKSEIITREKSKRQRKFLLKITELTDTLFSSNFLLA